jgi:quercetin dioxygenase-like cupin family protein
MAGSAMKQLDPIASARFAIAAHPARPATATIHDTADARIVVFRLAPGQVVAPHRSRSSVMIHVLEGSGILSGQDQEVRCARGAVVTYDPEELHGMRAEEEELLLMATIAPRPGTANR